MCERGFLGTFYRIPVIGPHIRIKQQRLGGPVSEPPESTSTVLTSAGAIVRARKILCKGVVQMELLYGSKIWVVTAEMLKVLKVFHHQLARRIAGNTDRWKVDGEREWTLVAYALGISGLWTIKDYIHGRKATIVAHIACRPIYEMCMKADKIPGYIIIMRWRDQDMGREIQ